LNRDAAVDEDHIPALEPQSAREEAAVFVPKLEMAGSLRKAI
jgi:hypothetical protein